MRLKKNIFILLLLSLLSSSCGKLFMLVVIGYREPKPETQKSIEKYGKKSGYDIQKQFYYIDSTQVEKTWKGAFPKAYIYDSSGQLMRHLDCFSQGLNDLFAFYKIPADKVKPVSDTLLIIMGKDTIRNVAPEFLQLKQQIHSFDSIQFVQLPKAKYYVVYFWSKSFGRINRKFGVPMEKFIQNHPELSSVFVKINCDFQRPWGYTKEKIKGV